MVCTTILVQRSVMRGNRGAFWRHNIGCSKASILNERGQSADYLRSASVAAEDVVVVGYSFGQVVGIECFSFRVGECFWCCNKGW